MGWDTVWKMGSEYPAREWAGDWWRGNELGFIINNPYFWSKNHINPSSITLGILPSQHYAIHPVMQDMFMIGQEGSAKYIETMTIVKEMIVEFLGTRKEIAVPRDITALVHQILNKVALKRNVSWEYAINFVSVQSSVVALGTVSQLLPSFLYGPMLGSVQAEVQKYVEEYVQLVDGLYGSTLEAEDCSPSDSCVHQAASMVWDALYAAGGLSVPGTISTGLGVLFSKSSSNPYPAASIPDGQAMNFYWENIRYFPPVVGFPHWKTRPTCPRMSAEDTAKLNEPDGKTKACPFRKNNWFTGYPPVNQYVPGGVREVPNLALAQRDPKRWGTDASNFTLRPLNQYQRNSVGFAEMAVNNSVADGRMNRVCPGRSLALLIGSTFFQEFDKSKWTPSTTDISFHDSVGFVSDFGLSS
jgi:hypothetical protein